MAHGHGDGYDLSTSRIVLSPIEGKDQESRDGYVVVCKSGEDGKMACPKCCNLNDKCTDCHEKRSTQDDSTSTYISDNQSSNNQSQSCKNQALMDKWIEITDKGNVVATFCVKVTEVETQDCLYCSECKAAFPDGFSVISHFKNHAGLKPFICVSCKFPSSTEKEAQSHYENHVNGDLSQDSINKTSSELHHGKIFNCTENEAIFISQENRECGERSEYVNVKNDEISFENNSKKSILRKGEYRWVCQTCEKPFRTSKALREHEVVHTGARDFPCNICGKAFGTAANMRIHRLTHTDQRPYSCSTCGATFRQKDSLKVHLRKHTGERPFECTVCKMTFDRNFTLKNHLLTHATEKSFVCSVCGKAFSTRGGLNNHERLHFKEPSLVKKERQPRAKPGSGNWVCDECGKIYSTRSNLQMHQKSHAPVQVSHICSVCSKAYKSRDSMEVHMRRHTNERPYQCSLCFRSFYRNYTLKLHILTHTGEKPQRCPVEGCTKSFAQSSSLAYHVRNHNKPKECSANGDNIKHSSKKRKLPQNNANNKISKDGVSSVEGSIGVTATEVGVPQDLKIGVPSDAGNIAFSNTRDTSVQSMLDATNNVAPQMVDTFPTVWDDDASLSMIGIVNSINNTSQQEPHNIESVAMVLQPHHSQQMQHLQYVPVETLPFLVSVPDGVLYHPDGTEKIQVVQPMLVSHLP